MPTKKVINILCYNETPSSLETFEYLKIKLPKLGYMVAETFDYNAELIISIGGDGSFLRALHKHNLPDIPIVGINTGNLGFFSETTPKGIDDFLEKYITGDYFIEEIHPIKAKICTKNKCIETEGINEIVVKANKSRTIHLSISVNDHLIQNFSGDGILIASSIGSTAYNYSAGGSIVDPSLEVLQITPLAPINSNAYRSFTSSVILPSNTIIKVNPEYRYEDSILLVNDGTEHYHTGITEISFKLSDRKIKLLRLKDFNFWTRVISKFL